MLYLKFMLHFWILFTKKCVHSFYFWTRWWFMFYSPHNQLFASIEYSRYIFITFSTAGGEDRDRGPCLWSNNHNHKIRGHVDIQLFCNILLGWSTVWFTKLSIEFYYYLWETFNQKIFNRNLSTLGADMQKFGNLGT